MLERLLAISVVSLLSVDTNAYAQQFTSPRDLLSSLYEVILFESRPVTDFEPYFSDQLTKKMRGGQLGPQEFKKLGFNPLTGLTETDLVTVFNLKSDQSAALTARAKATFRAGGVPVSISFDLIFESKHGWQIDQLSGIAGDQRWFTEDLINAVVEHSGS